MHLVSRSELPYPMALPGGIDIFASRTRALENKRMLGNEGFQQLCNFSVLNNCMHFDSVLWMLCIYATLDF
jgi:hypothetical protein